MANHTITFEILDKEILDGWYFHKNPYLRYKKWCKKKDYYPMTKKEFMAVYESFENWYIGD